MTKQYGTSAKINIIWAEPHFGKPGKIDVLLCAQHGILRKVQMFLKGGHKILNLEE